MRNATGHLDINRLRERAGEKTPNQDRAGPPGVARNQELGKRRPQPEGHLDMAQRNWPGHRIRSPVLLYCSTPAAGPSRTGTDSGFAAGTEARAPGTNAARPARQPGRTIAKRTSDPLRNIRERRARKSGFEYDPFPTKGLTE
jgi:hypothetical protein